MTTRLNAAPHRGPALDAFRLIAAVLVVTIHTSPLASVSPLADFWLTRVLARLGVPFFLVTTGYFLARRGWRGLRGFWLRTLGVYLAAAALYLPLNFYAGFSPAAWLRGFVWEGTFYHLWYFPALLWGVLLARGLAKLGTRPGLAVAAALYLIGLGGDSYFGLADRIPALHNFYTAAFSLTEYTRNGLFYAPVFLLLGAALAESPKTPRLRPAALGFAVSFAGMTAEGLWLHSLHVQRHDSMYPLLPVCLVFLFRLLLAGNAGRWRAARDASLLVYILHPGCIVAVRGLARALGLWGPLVENSLGHFAAVLALSAAAAALLIRLAPLPRRPDARAWRALDIGALLHNLEVLQQAAGPGRRVMAVVKADAYGHGAKTVARVLQQAGVQADWDRIYAVTAFFAGVSDDAVAPDYLPLIESAYGALPETAALPGEPEAFAAFQQQARQLAPAAINSMPIWDGQDRDEATAGFRFLGQRFTLDAAVFQQLIYPAVQPDEAGSQRMLPDALDLPAAFGSDTALQILTEQGAAAYPGYTENLESLRAALEKAPAETWSASLYAAWLDALRPLAEEKGEGWPQYMQSEAWAKKDLATMLGSWAELKHDTALYAKQVYAEMGGGGIEPVDDRGYVEAEPAVFGKLSALCTATANGLDALGLLSDTQAADLAKMAELNRQLMTIAEKELRGELPTDEEFELIRSFGGQLEHFWTEAVADEAAGIYTPMQMPAALVADVATDPNGIVLQVGTGIQTIYVVVEVDGSPRLASGTVFGFYQFAQPMDERLTDEEWQAQLGLSFDENIGFVEPQNRPQPVEWSRDATLLTTYDMG